MMEIYGKKVLNILVKKVNKLYILCNKVCKRIYKDFYYYLKIMYNKVIIYYPLKNISWS